MQTDIISCLQIIFEMKCSSIGQASERRVQNHSERAKRSPLLSSPYRKAEIKGVDNNKRRQERFCSRSGVPFPKNLSTSYFKAF